MQGTLQVLRDGNGNVIYPVTTAESVYVGDDINLEERLKELDQFNTTYVVDPYTWGMSVGKPSKPYVAEDYHKANRNVSALDRVLAWAKLKGYTKVVLPPKEFPICFPNVINAQSNMIFDLNGAKLPIIFDSVNKSPYFNGDAGDPAWDFYGMVVKIGNMTTNFHIMGGQIQGDYYERSYTDPLELYAEHSYGISLNEGASFCSITNMKVNGFMGDPINIRSDGGHKEIIDPAPPLAIIDDATGVVTPTVEALTLISGLKPIPMLPDGSGRYKNLTIYGRDYTRYTALRTKRVSLYFYTEDGTYIGCHKRKRVMAPIDFPLRAAQYRISFEETDPTKNLFVNIMMGGLPNHNVISGNEVWDGHRGGMTLGGSYNIVENNTFRGNGKSNFFMTGISPFPDSTRYAVNQEDSFGDHNVLRNNNVYGGYHGFLLRGFTVLVEGNVIDVDESAVVLYDQQFAVIRDNTIRNCGVTLFGSLGMVPAVVKMTGNFMYNGYLDSGATHGSGGNGQGYDADIVDNYFEDCWIDAGDAVLKGNRFKYNANAAKVATFTGKKNYSENTFIGTDKLTTKVMVSLGYRGTFKNCDFENINMVAMAGARANFKGSTFKKSYVGGELNTSYTYLKDCDLDESGFYGAGEFVMDGSVQTVSLLETIFTFDSATAGIIRLLNNKIAFSHFNVTLTNVIHNLKAGLVEVEMVNNNFDFTGERFWPTYPLGNAAVITKSNIYNNTFKNMVIYLPIPSTNHTQHDPIDSSSSKPTRGYFQKGYFRKNSVLAVGQPLGWYCITSGFSTTLAWSSGTTVSDGTFLHSGGNVYVTMTAGALGTTAPTHTTGTVLNGTVVQLKYIAPLAVFATAPNLST